jgi:hypothetical protein
MQQLGIETFTQDVLREYRKLLFEFGIKPDEKFFP